MVQQIEGEELGKFFRFAMEAAKIDNYLKDGATAKGASLQLRNLKSSVKATEDLLSERQDVAGLARILGVDNKLDPDYISSPQEILESQARLIRLAETGKLTEKDLTEALSWLHTSDITLTKERYERATYKTFDQSTGEKFSAEKIAANKAKFLERSGGDERKYITMQVVEELGEFLEQHLIQMNTPKNSQLFKILEAQKRDLKSARFGESTVIKDEGSIYFGKTNKESAEMAAKEAGIPTRNIVKSANTALTDNLPELIGDDALIVKADADPFINGYLSKRKDTLKVIGDNQGLISVEDVDGWKKVSAVWIDEASRGQGLADAAINQLVGKSKSFAFIEPKNTASQALFKRLGYQQTGTRVKDATTYQLWERAAGVDPIIAKMNQYKTALALEQDASSSGAQIIALTTKNKQLAEMSNVVPTTQKRRLDTYGLVKLH
jgi:ribosomal protein S18 acetylase RimI-like enzyme